MIGTVLLLGFLVTATFTDLRRRKIFNWTTYPGILTAILASALATAFGVDDVQGTDAARRFWGLVSFQDALVGLFACGAILIVCYVFFPGGVGGGDVKLIAMIGAYLGLHAGLEALLWTFILGGCQALITLVWRLGAIEFLRRAVSFSWFTVRSGGQLAIETQQAATPATSMFLSPSALAAALLVRFHVLEWLRY